MHLVELDMVTDVDWQHLIAGERNPWGDVDESLRWRDKTHNLGLRDDADRLVALGGLVMADLRVGTTPLQVAGIGGVFVTRSARGRGLARVLIESLLQLAGEFGAERAMLFCLPANVGLYTKFGFLLIEAPVWAHQPRGLIEVPMCAMWKPLAGAASWPAGKVELLDEPF